MQLRRGFDTLTQFSTGLVAATQAGLEKPETRLRSSRSRLVDASRPRHARRSARPGSGYAIAAAIRGLTRRLTAGEGSVSHLPGAHRRDLDRDGRRGARTGAGDRASCPGAVRGSRPLSWVGPVRRLAPGRSRQSALWEHPAECAGAEPPNGSPSRRARHERPVPGQIQARRLGARRPWHTRSRALLPT